MATSLPVAQIRNVTVILKTALFFFESVIRLHIYFLNTPLLQEVELYSPPRARELDPKEQSRKEGGVTLSERDLVTITLAR